MLLLHSSLTFLPTPVGQPQKMSKTTAQVVQVYFSNTTRDIQEQCFPWAAPWTRPVADCTLVAPEVIAEGRRGSKTHLGLCSLSLVKTLEVDNLDLANTAFKSPPHCQLLTQASDDKNATLDEMGGEKKKDLSDEMRSAAVTPILYFTQKRSHNSATSQGTRNKAGSRVRKDNYRDIYLLEMC